jgi:Spy/CpxP family protein refolding chaperone
MRTVRNVLVLALVLAMAAPLMAQREGRRKEGKEPRPEKRVPRDPMQFMLGDMLAGIELTAEQKAKLEQVKKEMGPKLMEARKKTEGILTEEQRKARAEAEKAAKVAGKKGKEARDAVEAAVKLTEEQQAKLKEASKAARELQNQVRDKVMALLTPEQQEAIKAKMKERMKKLREEGKKPGEGKKRGKQEASEK